MRYSKVVVALCIAVTTAYTAGVLLLSLLSGQLPPDSLTVAVFAMYGLELSACAVIKVKDADPEPSGRHVKGEGDSE